MKYIKIALYSIMFASICFVMGCSNDDDAGPVGAETFVMAIQTDLGSGAGFLVPLDSFPSGSYDFSSIPSNAFQVSNARLAGFAFGNSIYHPTNPAGQQGIQKITPNSVTGGLEADGFINGAVYFEVVSEDKGYYWDPDLGQTDLQIFDPSSMARTSEIALGGVTEITTLLDLKSDQIASATIDQFMIERDGLLFTQLDFVDENNFIVYDSSFIISIDIATDQFVDLTTIPLGLQFREPNHTAHAVSVAENGDMYLGTFGNVGSSFIPRGSYVTRIRSGQTQFDSNYQIDIDAFIGGTSFMISGPLVDGNNLYLKYWSEPLAPDFSNAADLEFKVFVTDVDNPVQPTVIDQIPGVTTATLQTTGPFIRDNLIYFPVNNQEFNGYYTINRTTDEVQVAINAPGVVSQGIYVLQE